VNKLIWTSGINFKIPAEGDYGAVFTINGSNIGNTGGSSKLAFLMITAMNGTKFYADYRTGLILGRNLDVATNAWMATESDEEVDIWVDNYRKMIDSLFHESQIQKLHRSEFWDILQCRG
jgi:hypothetical protein